MNNNELMRLALPVGAELPEWSGEIIHQESRHLTFWDTFEWGLWLNDRLLYSCEGVYHLCVRDGGWPGEEIAREASVGKRCFWSDFTTSAMRSPLEEMLGLRGLTPVVEGVFRRRQGEIRK